MLVFQTIFPIVAIALAGFAVRRGGFLDEAETAALEKATLWYFLPALLFLGTAQLEFPENMDWSFFAAFYLAVLLVFLAGMLLGRLVFGLDAREQSVFGMGCAYSNVTVIGIPVVLELLGEAAFLPLFMIIAVHNLAIFTFGTLMAERQGAPGGSLPRHLWQVSRGVMLNPITGSLLAGLAVNLSGLPLWVPMVASLELLSRAAVPLALFALGCSLTRYRIRGELLTAFLMVAAKLVLLPLLVWGLATKVFQIDPLWSTTAVLLSAMPVGISVYVFSRRYQRCETAAAAAIVLSSLLSVISLSFFAWWLLPQTAG